MAEELYLVWNKPRNECVGFKDLTDAMFTATGDHGYSAGIGVSTLGDEFRGIYAEDGDDILPITKATTGEEVTIQ